MGNVKSAIIRKGKVRLGRLEKTGRFRDRSRISFCRKSPVEISRLQAEAPDRIRCDGKYYAADLAARNDCRPYRSGEWRLVWRAHVPRKRRSPGGRAGSDGQAD